MPELSSDAASQHSRTIAMLMWIGTLVFNFIPGLVIFLSMQDDNYLQEQAKEALNWSITLLIGWMIGYLLIFILIGFAVLPVIAMCDIVFCIMGAVACSEGRAFRVPFAIRLVK